MPWCCGTANSGGTTTTALITTTTSGSNTNATLQEPHTTVNDDSTTIATPKSTNPPDHFGPMLIQPQKTALFITASQQPNCPFIETLQSSGWHVIKTTTEIAKSTYQEHLPLLVLLDVRLPDIPILARTMCCLPAADEVFFAILSDRPLSEKRKRWFSQFDLFHIFVSSSTDVALCEFFARLLTRLRAIPAVFAVLEEADQPIEICDNALNVQYINRAYESSIGCSRNEVLGKKSSDIRRKSSHSCISRPKDTIFETSRGPNNDWRCIQVPGSSNSPQFVYMRRNSVESMIMHRDISLKSIRSQTALVDAPINEVLFSLRDVMHRVDDETQQILRDAIRVLSSTELYAPTITRFGNNDPIATSYYDGLIRVCIYHY